MEPKIALAVPMQEKLPMKKKGWRRFLSFFTSGKSKSKEVVEKNHKDAKTPEPGTTESQIYQVRSEAAVLLNSEVVRLAENLPMVSKKRKLLSLQRMFGKSDSSKDREKSSNKIFSSKTYVEVYDCGDKLTVNDKAADEHVLQVNEAKTDCVEQIESQVDSEIAKVTSVSDNNDDSEASKNLIESLSDCPLMSTIDRSLGLSSSHVEERTKKGNFRRFFKNRFGRRSPSKMNLSSKTIVEIVVEDETEVIPALEEIITKDVSDEVQGIEKEDQPLENECHIDQVEHQMEPYITQVECKISQEQQLKLESVEPAEDDPQEVESNDLEMPIKTKDESEAQSACSAYQDGIPEADNMPAESKNVVNPDKICENAPSRPVSPKKDADSKDHQIFINHRPSKIHRIKKLRFNLPTIDELPENDATTNDALEVVDCTKTDREMTKKESKLDAVIIDNIQLNEEIKSELIPEDDMAKSDCNAVTDENNNAELCELSMIGDNPNVGQDNCENALLSSDEGDAPKNSNDKKFNEVTEVLTEQI